MLFQKLGILKWMPIFLLASMNCSDHFDEKLYLNKTKSVVGLFKSELQTNLLKAVKERGAENAIEVCSEISPRIEDKISSENNLQIRRVSDKYRNPNHKPDDWEQEVIQKWKQDLKEGKSITLYSELRNSEFRVLNPIVLENPTCLQCHGNSQEIKPTTLKRIQEKYPNDNAKDYKLGELRGAFSSRWKI